MNAPDNSAPLELSLGWTEDAEILGKLEGLDQALYQIPIGGLAESVALSKRSAKPL